MPKHTITLDQLIVWKPCDLSTRKALFASRANLSVSQALDAGATVSDILWVAEKLELTLECVVFATRCAENVAHLNSDPRVQKAINAAKNYVENPAPRAASDAADEAAADAAYEAAYAAARVEDREAAHAAAYAAADAADAAARAETEKFQKDLLIEIFE